MRAGVSKSLTNSAVRFALVDRGAQTAAGEFALELMLANGDRLRIGAGVDAKTLGTVLEVLRA